MSAEFRSAIESAQNDHLILSQRMMENKEAHVEKLRSLFQNLGGSNVLTYGMLEEKLKSPEVRDYFETIGISLWDAWSFFKLLDVDAGGSVELEEFFLGCLRFRGHARAMDVGMVLQDQKWQIESQGNLAHVRSCEFSFCAKMRLLGRVGCQESRQVPEIRRRRVDNS